MLNKEDVPRENPATQTPLPEAPPISQVNIFGRGPAATELYGACILTVEIASIIESLPDIVQILGKEIVIRLMTTRLCAQQALDHARRNS